MKTIVLRHLELLSSEDRDQLLARSTHKVFDPRLMNSIRDIFEDVQTRGDQAVIDFTEKFDGVSLARSKLRVTGAEMEAAHAQLDPALLRAIREGIANVRRFNEAQMKATLSGWHDEPEAGVLIGEQLAPIPNCGLFVPCGKASYPSVLYQIATPALVAGVAEISVVVPPLRGTPEVDSATLATAHELGLSRVFRCNGPAGIAALSLGTESFPKVLKIVGPGSPAVSSAQVIAQTYGVATTMVCGPSESAIIADDHCDLRWLAADMLNEAEHGEDSASLLITPSLPLAEAVDAEITEQLQRLPATRRTAAMSALTVFGGALLVRSMDEAVDFVNEYAPEHLQIATKEPEMLLPRIKYAGEVLLGQYTPISASNFMIGVPATLPTGGFARSTPGVTARTFMTASAYSRLSADALRRLALPTMTLAAHEGFPAHANAIRVRE